MTELLPDESPVGDSDGDGAIERASLSVQGQVRALKEWLELKLRATISLDIPYDEVAGTARCVDLGDLPEGRRRHDRAPEDPREDFQRAWRPLERCYSSSTRMGDT
jgi:hypothetical protein